jgi:hypothetical protein
LTRRAQIEAEHDPVDVLDGNKLEGKVDCWEVAPRILPRACFSRRSFTALRRFGSAISASCTGIWSAPRRAWSGFRQGCFRRGPLVQASIVYALATLLGIHVTFSPLNMLGVVALTAVGSGLFSTFSLIIACP